VQTVIYGNKIKFNKVFLNTNNQYIDPTSITFSIVKNLNSVLYGPYVYGSGATSTSLGSGFTKAGTGVYVFTQFIESFVVPGLYSAKWQYVIGGVTNTYYETFQVMEEAYSVNRIVDPPTLAGKIIEKPSYNDMNFGATDRICLIGHADGLELNVPHRVINMQETINMLGADAESPLLRGLFEAYNAGARDIWLVASAPMFEYIPFTHTSPDERKAQRADLGGLSFYQKYSQRLDETYTMLRDEDFPEIVVPLEAPFFDSGDVDFLTPLLFNCMQRYRENGNVSIGIIGTRIGDATTGIADKLLSDPRISRLQNGSYIFSTKLIFLLLRYHYGVDLFKTDTNQAQVLNGQDIGKFGMIVAGEGVFNVPQIDTPFTSSLAVVTAALMATRNLNEGIIHRKLPRVANLVGYKFSKDEVKSLAQARVNVATLTPVGRRGNIFETYIATDNTLANGWPDNNPDANNFFWSISTLRLINKISQQIVSLGRRRLGTIEYAQFRSSVINYLNGLKIGNFIRDFRLDIYRGNDENRTVYVDLVIHPYFSIREIYFTVEVGSGTGE
jgi:hypothetical protein